MAYLDSEAVGSFPLHTHLVRNRITKSFPDSELGHASLQSVKVGESVMLAGFLRRRERESRIYYSSTVIEEMEVPKQR